MAAGHVFVGTAAPRAFAKAGIADRCLDQSRVLRRCGPYVIGARLTESVPGEPPAVPGVYVNLFSADLGLAADLAIEPGRCGLWVDVDRVSAPGLVASASRVRQWAVAGHRAVFSSVAPLGTHTVTWLRLPAAARAVQVTTHSGMPVEATHAWDAARGLLRLEHAATPDGSDVSVAWRGPIGGSLMATVARTPPCPKRLLRDRPPPRQAGFIAPGGRRPGGA